MSVVIVGGNECMTRMYKDLCAEYECSAKIYTKPENNLKNIGSPDLLIFFTSTVSHKMVDLVAGRTKNAVAVLYLLRFFTSAVRFSLS